MAAYLTFVLAFMLFSSVQKSFGQSESGNSSTQESLVQVDVDNLVSLTEHCVRDIAVVMEDVKILMHQPDSDETPTSKPRNCQDVKNAGQETNGLATIFLPPQSMDITNPLTVFCDQTTADGGWLILLKRIDSTELFTSRLWKDYKRGFGNPITGSFWLGLENMHQLTRDHHATLRIELEDFDDEMRYAEYNYFRVTSESDGYRLFIDGYSGDAGDSLQPHNGQRFSTIDKDQDAYSGNCISQYKGGWWYKSCLTASLTGEYIQGGNAGYYQGMVWRDWRGGYYSYKRAEMKIRF